MERRHTGPRTLRRLPPGWEPAAFTRFDLAPCTATIGALVDGIDLRQPIDGELFQQLDRALLEWKVLFFRDQPLSPDQHAAFAGRWGPLLDDQLVSSEDKNPVENVVVFTRDAETPGLENEWHADGTFRAELPMGTVLRAVEVPMAGGDTLFADMAVAFDDLSEAERLRIETLSAIHDWSLGEYAAKYADRMDELRSLVPPIEQPLVRLHPVTGRKTLFVNRLFTGEIVGLPPDEGRALLDRLYRQADLPELQVRFRWEPDSIAFWDNAAVQHYGVNDYHPKRRVMARASIARRHPSLPAR